MATAPETVAFFSEQLEGRGVRTRRMFGEYGVYAGEKFVALICDDCLFVRPLPAAAAYLGTPVEGLPYPGAKPHFRVEPDRWEDGDWLWGLISLMERDLPAPAAKHPKPRTSPPKQAKKH